MKGLNNNLGSILTGRKTELSSIMQMINPKPTKPHWQRTQQMLTWSNFTPKDSWKEGSGQNNIQRSKKVAITRNYMLQNFHLHWRDLVNAAKAA